MDHDPPASGDEHRELVAKYQRLREEIDNLYSKLAQVDSDRSEHELVLKQLSTLEGSRKCWQQIGAVLAEKTVEEVLPVLTTNKEQLVETVKKLTNAIENREKELAEMTKKYGIRQVSASTAAAI